MLDPSSSEEESEELLEEDRRDVLVVSSSGGGAGHRTLHAPSRDSRDTTLTRPASPSPSINSEGREELERVQREERERRSRLQLYVFIMRCIAYPFNAKQPTDMTRRQQKLNKPQLQTIRERFQAFLKGDTQIAADEAFINAVRSYYEAVYSLMTPFDDEAILTLEPSNSAYFCKTLTLFQWNIQERSLPNFLLQNGQAIIGPV